MRFRVVHRTGSTDVTPVTESFTKWAKSPSTLSA